MKASVKQIVDAYKALGNAKTTKLDGAEKGKILKARKAMRPIAEEFDAFLKDCQEKFKPENWDELQARIQEWDTLTKEEKNETNKAFDKYQKSIDGVVKEELEKEVELTFDKLSEGADVKIMSASDWTPNQLDALEIMF